jgi:hypothetical protein
MMEQIYDIENLERAWLWIKSNPDRMYKSYFRDSYRNFEVVSSQVLNSISAELRNGTYIPTSSCKIFLPKPSGILRPYSLLTIKDQIVYQAYANIVAEKLYPHIHARYNKKTFGHQYAGASSTWFYKKWSTCYKRYNKAAKGAFESGKIYSAGFDLTACYDSIDHGVLSHYLQQIGVDEEIPENLCQLLSTWTATNHEQPIYQHHGIPQGPLSSGIISEVVLQAFDAERLVSDVSFFRYVDDIKLFSSSETKLRSQLVKLDAISKKIGLFPQSSKIEIHRVTDIEDEIKNLSHPGSFDPDNTLNQKEIETEIWKATKQLKIKDVSKLRYYTAISRPNKKVIDRLWNLYYKYPHLYTVLTSLLKKSENLSISDYTRLLKELKRNTPYDHIYAEFISILFAVKLKNQQKNEVAKLVKENFYKNGKSLLNGETSLSSNVCHLLIKFDAFTDKQLDFVASAPKWFTRQTVASCIAYKDKCEYPEKTIHRLARDSHGDVSLFSGKTIIYHNYKTPQRIGAITASYLKTFGRYASPANECQINSVMNEMLKTTGNPIEVNWKSLLDGEYAHAIEKIVDCKSSLTTNARAWIIDLDNFNEIVLRKFFEKDGSIGVIGGRIWWCLFYKKSISDKISNSS